MSLRVNHPAEKSKVLKYKFGGRPERPGKAVAQQTLRDRLILQFSTGICGSLWRFLVERDGGCSRGGSRVAGGVRGAIGGGVGASRALRGTLGAKQE
jgi:hypothetical protein